MFEISTFEFVRNEFLTNRVNFGMGCIFSKFPESAFTEGLTARIRVEFLIVCDTAQSQIFTSQHFDSI